MSDRSHLNQNNISQASTELGENGLPEGWTEAAISSLCHRQRGVSYGRDDAKDKPADGLIPILRANNIDGNGLNFGDLVYVPSSLVAEKQKLRPGDIVIAMSSGSKSVVGKTAQIFDEWSGSFGAFCGVLSPLTNPDEKFFDASQLISDQTRSSFVE